MTTNLVCYNNDTCIYIYKCKWNIMDSTQLRLLINAMYTVEQITIGQTQTGITRAFSL